LTSKSGNDMTKKIKPIHFILIAAILTSLAVIFYFIGRSMGS